MPELPEVELVARSLDAIVRGRTIVSAELIRPRLAPDSPPETFSAALSGTTINFIHRRGKHILIDLTGGKTLIVHLRMSGRFSLVGGDETPPKFTHAIFRLESGDVLAFDDQRHFGLMKLVGTEQLFESKELAKLAPEPFSDDFSVEYLHSALRSSRRSIKEFVLDQTKVCGLGNIYAAEAFFAAGIDPRKRADRLTRRSASRLHAAIRAVLETAISGSAAAAGPPDAAEIGYFDRSGEAAWRVYGRENEPCPVCGMQIRRIRQAGRSTYFCGKCQRN